MNNYTLYSTLETNDSEIFLPTDLNKKRLNLTSSNIGMVDKIGGMVDKIGVKVFISQNR